MDGWDDECIYDTACSLFQILDHPRVEELNEENYFNHRQSTVKVAKTELREMARRYSLIPAAVRPVSNPIGHLPVWFRKIHPSIFGSPSRVKK